jgi:hypothetical protein
MWLRNLDPFRVEQIRSTEAAEMRFLRWIAGYKLPDRRRSEETRRKLEAHSICETTDLYRIGGEITLLRIADSRSDRIAWNYRPRGCREVGRRGRKRRK